MPQYFLSFTAAGSLMKSECSLIVERFIDLRCWERVADEIIEQNLLQSRTKNTAKRIGSELIKRLKKLSEEELGFYGVANYKDQGYLLWLAICRCYRFLGELAAELLHERFVTLQISLNHEDYNYFFTQKAALNEKLANLSERTQTTLRQSAFKIMRDAELLTRDNLILPAMMSKELARLLAHGDGQEFLYFPIFNADVAQLIQ